MDLPYHHDWQPVLENSIEVRVKWFGTWGNDPFWKIEQSRLASDLICFFYLLKGKCSVVINGVSSEVNAGDLVVIKGADLFSFTQDTQHIQTSLSACLSLHQDNTTNTLLQYSYKRVSRIHDTTLYENTFYEVLEALQQNGTWKSLHATAALLKWVALIQEMLNPQSQEPDQNSKTVAYIHAAQQWAHQHLGRDITVKQWANACGLNVDYFSRIFKLHTGMSPRPWIVEKRLQAAARLLSITPQSVEKIAEICGFSCPYYFSRTFKKKFGLPPSLYRKTHHVKGFEK